MLAGDYSHTNSMAEKELVHKLCVWQVKNVSTQVATKVFNLCKKSKAKEKKSNVSITSKQSIDQQKENTFITSILR